MFSYVQNFQSLQFENGFKLRLHIFSKTPKIEEDTTKENVLTNYNDNFSQKSSHTEISTQKITI